MNPRNKIGIILLVLLIIAAGYYFFSTDRSKDVVLIGTVDSNQVIVSSKVPGRIEKLNVIEGDHVKEGDLIAVIDSADLEAQRQAAQATLASLRSKIAEAQYTQASSKGETSSAVANALARVQAARAALAEAEADLVRIHSDTQRMVSLADQGVASQQQKDQALATLKAQQARVQTLKDQLSAAQADVETARARTNQATAAQNTVAATRAQAASAQAQLAETEARLGYTKIVAPVSGTVSVRAAREGEVVNAGTPIVTVVDLNDTWIWAPLPETYADRIPLGQKLPVRLPSGTKVEGTVTFKGAEADFATQRDVSRIKRDIKTVEMKIKVDNHDGRLVPGMTADVLIPADLGRTK